MREYARGIMVPEESLLKVARLKAQRAVKLLDLAQNTRRSLRLQRMDGESSSVASSAVVRTVENSA